MLSGVSQVITHVRQVLTRNAELAQVALSAHGQDDFRR